MSFNSTSQNQITGYNVHTIYPQRYISLILKNVYAFKRALCLPCAQEACVIHVTESDLFPWSRQSYHMTPWPG